MNFEEKNASNSMGIKSVGDKRLVNELKKLEWSVNYDRKVNDRKVADLCGGSSRRGKGILQS